MTTKTLPVPFHGDTLYLIEHEGEPYTPVKPIVEGMGLAWPSQFEKLKANKDRWGITMIVIPSSSGDQETVCMPVRKLPAFLTTIHPNKVKPEIRDRVIAYQNECDDVLWRYWSSHTPPAPALPVIPSRMRMMLVFEDGQMVSSKLIPDDAYIATPDNLPEIVREALPGKQVVDIDADAFCRAWLGQQLHFPALQEHERTHVGYSRARSYLGMAITEFGKLQSEHGVEISGLLDGMELAHLMLTRLGTMIHEGRSHLKITLSNLRPEMMSVDLR